MDDWLASGWEVDEHIVAIVLEASCRTEDARAGRAALSILDAPGVDICGSRRVLHAVLKACMRWADFERLDLALREFQHREHCLRPRRYTYFLAIRGNAALGRTGDAQLVWDSMLRRNVQPSSLEVACMINTLVSGGRVEEALGVFRAWKGAVCYDASVYTALIRGFSTKRDPDRAIALFEDMKSAGVHATSVTYTTLIAACTHDDAMSRAHAVFHKIVDSGCKPTVSMYGALISGHCRVGSMREALELLCEMYASGLSADSVLYNTILGGCVAHELWDLATVVLQEMDDNGIRRTSFTAALLVKMWSKRGELERAVEVVRRALASGEAASCGRMSKHRPGSVDPRLASCLIGACMHNRAPERALELFDEMKAWHAHALGSQSGCFWRTGQHGLRTTRG